jgi:hypothetical protein
MKQQHSIHRPLSIFQSPRLRLLAVATALAWLPGTNAIATEFNTGNPDVKVRWDNTIKYTAARRMEGRSESLLVDINQDDGTRNFGKGLISNRVDLLSELDVSLGQRFGFRASGAGWYDTVYHRDNANNSPATINQVSAPSNRFTDATRRLHGGKAEILDAFVYANGELGNVRLGRHTILYGETLFFGVNGIANAQAPVDVVKLLSVPNSQFKEIILPVKQVSGQVELSEGITLGGYYQFEFRRSRIPAVGSYFSASDLFDAGGERFLFAPGVGVPRIEDKLARDSGQGGLQLRWRPKDSNMEYGFYAVNYHDKGFQMYLRPVGVSVPGFPANYQLVYPEDIKSYGVSFSTEVAGANVAGEASIRRNTPLVSGGIADTTPTGSFDNKDHPGYAVGNSAHLNLSAIVFLNRSSVWDNANVVAELAWNRRTSITSNAAELDPNTTRDAWAMRTVFSPSWYQVAPGLDLSAPVGLGYSTRGNSSVVSQFNSGVKRGGDLSIGLKGVYQQAWNIGLNYTHFIGSAGVGLGPDANLTFKQTFADRDFLSLSVQRTF